MSLFDRLFRRKGYKGLRRIKLEYRFPREGLLLSKKKKEEYLGAFRDKMEDLAPRMSPGVPEDWGYVVSVDYELEPPCVRLTLDINPSCESILRKLYSEQWEWLCDFLRKREAR